MEVIDLRTLARSTWRRSSSRSQDAPARRRARGGRARRLGAEIAAAVQAAAFDDLDAPIERVGAPFAPVPFSPPLEDAFLPVEQM